MYRGRLSYRRLWVLVSHLPQESWTQTELRDSTPDDALLAQEQRFGPWALVNYQMAQLVDAIRRVEYVSAALGGANPEPPSPTPRPGANRPVRKQAPAQVAYLQNLRAKGA